MPKQDNLANQAPNQAQGKDINIHIFTFFIVLCEIFSNKRINADNGNEIKTIALNRSRSSAKAKELVQSEAKPLTQENAELTPSRDMPQEITPEKDISNVLAQIEGKSVDVLKHYSPEDQQILKEALASAVFKEDGENAKIGRVMIHALNGMFIAEIGEFNLAEINPRATLEQAHAEQAALAREQAAQTLEKENPELAAQKNFSDDRYRHYMSEIQAQMNVLNAERNGPSFWTDAPLERQKEVNDQVSGLNLMRFALHDAADLSIPDQAKYFAKLDSEPFPTTAEEMRIDIIHDPILEPVQTAVLQETSVKTEPVQTEPVGTNGEQNSSETPTKEADENSSETSKTSETKESLTQQPFLNYQSEVPTIGTPIPHPNSENQSYPMPEKTDEDRLIQSIESLSKGALSEYSEEDQGILRQALARELIDSMNNPSMIKDVSVSVNEQGQAIFSANVGEISINAQAVLDQYHAQIDQASTHSNTDYPPLIDGRSTTLRSYEAVIDAKDAIIEKAIIYADNTKDFLNQNNRGEHAETLPGAMLNTLSYVSDPFLGSAAGLAALSESIAGLATKAYQGLNAAQIARIEAVAQELANFPKSTLEAGLNSFSHKASEILKEVGLTMEEFLNIKNTLVTDLSRPQIRQLKTIRNSIPMPTKDTLLQKVTPEADIAKYLSGQYKEIGGYIAQVDDISHVKKTEDVIESLRLDYPNAPFSKESGYGVIRFKVSNPEIIEIPVGAKFGGKNTDGLPCTLNGFTACRNGHIIPEFKQPYNLPENGAKLLHVDKNGVETLLAIFGKDELGIQRFIPETKGQ